MKVEVYKREDGLFDWRVRADNGQIIATSGGQGYTERNDAAEGWERLAALDEMQLEIVNIHEAEEGTA